MTSILFVYRIVRLCKIALVFFNLTGLRLSWRLCKKQNSIRPGKSVGRTAVAMLIIAGILALDIVCWKTAYVYLGQERPLPFEYVGECEIYEEDLFGRDIWVPIQDDLYDFTYEYLAENCNLEDLTFDFDRYKYIVAQNYRITDITVNYIDVWGKFSQKPFYHPRVSLCDGDEKTLYIYRVDASVPFRNDIHGDGGFTDRTLHVNPAVD